MAEAKNLLHCLPRGKRCSSDSLETRPKRWQSVADMCHQILVQRIIVYEVDSIKHWYKVAFILWSTECVASGAPTAGRLGYTGLYWGITEWYECRHLAPADSLIGVHYSTASLLHLCLALCPSASYTSGNRVRELSSTLVLCLCEVMNKTV